MKFSDFDRKYWLRGQNGSDFRNPRQISQNPDQISKIDTKTCNWQKSELSTPSELGEQAIFLRVFLVQKKHGFRKRLTQPFKVQNPGFWSNLAKVAFIISTFFGQNWGILANFGALKWSILKRFPLSIGKKPNFFFARFARNLGGWLLLFQLFFESRPK